MTLGRTARNSWQAAGQPTVEHNSRRCGFFLRDRQRRRDGRVERRSPGGPVDNFPPPAVANDRAVWHKCDSFLVMKNKPNQSPEDKLLVLLQEVLPKATPDPRLAGKIYEAVETQLKARTRAAAFEKFCAKVALPDLEPKSIAEVKQQLAASFDNGDVTVKADRKAGKLAVEISLTNGHQFSGEIEVDPAKTAEPADDPEVTLKFVPFPVCLPGDPEVIWLLAKRENLTSPEAAILLSKVETEFWASKSGQKLLRDRVERSFPEFIARVPSGMLSEAGLKRHYKEPEPVQSLRPVPKPGKERARMEAPVS